jgi:hypothetical protein
MAEGKRDVIHLWRSNGGRRVAKPGLEPIEYRSDSFKERPMASGKCLCEAVRFSIEVEPRLFYRCHCTLCRKQTGVGHNLATLVHARDFRWEEGQRVISSWRKPSGYRNDFCSRCGSTVPNALRESDYFWIPLGLLDVELNMECVGDFCTDDAMPWDEQRSANSHHAAPDSLEFLLQALQVRHFR